MSLWFAISVASNVPPSHSQLRQRHVTPGIRPYARCHNSFCIPGVQSSKAERNTITDFICHGLHIMLRTKPLVHSHCRHQSQLDASSLHRVRCHHILHHCRILHHILCHLHHSWILHRGLRLLHQGRILHHCLHDAAHTATASSTTHHPS